MDDTDLSRQYPSTSKKKKQNEEVPEMVGLMEERTQAVRRPDNQDQTTGMFDDKSLYSIARDIHACEWKELAIRLGFTQPEVSHIEADYRHSVVEQICNMLVSWSQKRPGDDVSHLHKALEEVRQGQGGARTSLQPGQPSVDMSENQPSTSQQPTTQGAVSNPLTPECSTSDVQSQAAAAKCKDALKLHYRTTGSYLHQNPYEVDKKRIPDIYTRLQLANAKGDLEDPELTFKESDFEQSVLDIALK
ncbi:uncharacterized protein LOC110981216, partial [Acanthaster planci]|uniref:Uncharacterized protein LOC110981216 n=1 Tax=Acanthaster planci TaxID=133434 RepID=A0A8B7YLY0_ACAPL